MFQLGRMEECELNDRKIFSAGPSISQKEIEYVNDAIRNAWYEGAYAYISEFENAVAQYVGRQFALALPSGTSAIHLSLLASGITEGDEVIVPDFTWVATAAPLSYIGAKPVFVDVDRDSWCITPNQIRKRITARTKAIYTVDIFGNMPDYDSIYKIVDEYGLNLLEDSAEAIGSSYKGKKAGSFGNASIFSFHGSKLLTTGEGGMLVTDNEELFERARKLANYGRDYNSNKMFWFDEVGYKYKYTSLQAAMGLAQIERIDEILCKRRQIFEWYSDELSGVDGIEINTPGEGVFSNYWMTTAVFDENIYNLTKEDVVAHFKSQNIESRPVVYQLSSMPAYGFIRQDWRNPVTEHISKMGVNLPTSHILNKEDVVYVVRVLKDFLESRRVC